MVIGIAYTVLIGLIKPPNFDLTAFPQVSKMWYYYNVYGLLGSAVNLQIIITVLLQRWRKLAHFE